MPATHHHQQQQQQHDLGSLARAAAVAALHAAVGAALALAVLFSCHPVVLIGALAVALALLWGGRDGRGGAALERAVGELLPGLAERTLARLAPGCAAGAGAASMVALAALAALAAVKLGGVLAYAAAGRAWPAAADLAARVLSADPGGYVYVHRY